MTNLRLYMHQPAICFAGRVNQASFTYPLDEVTYDGATFGAGTDVFDGMTVLFGTSAGADDLGRQRIRKASTSTLLRIGRSSQGTRDGEVDLVDNAHITVLWDFRVWAKIPFIDIDDDYEIYKDSDIYATGNVADPPPVANGGKGYAGTIDPTTGLITVEFDGSNSFQFDTPGTSLLTSVADYLWQFDDGTITVGTITSATVTVTFPAGFRYVLLTVNSTAGKAHQCYIPVFARDPDDDVTLQHNVTMHVMRIAGQEIAFRVLQDIPRASWHDGALMMLWDDDLQDPDPFRPHMLFVGWHQTDNGGVRAERTASLRDTTLTCVDTVGRLKTLPGFSMVIEAITIPSKWTQTRYPNALYYFCHLLYWHSTALEVSDLLLGTQILNDFAFKIVGSDEGNLYDQVNDLANRITPDHYLTCNSGNQLMLVVDPIIQNVGDRSSSFVDTLDDTDWSEISFGYQRPPRVFRLLASAIKSDDTEASVVWSIAPGLAEGQGVSRVETSERFTFSQFSLDVTTGNRYARMNARYGMFNLTVPYSRLSIANDPAYMRWVRLTVASTNEPQRGLPFTVQRGIVHEINISYDYQRTGLVRTATLTWEMETSGPAALTYEPPEIEGA